MPVLRLPDGSVVNFPDSMSPQEIKAAVEKASMNKRTGPPPTSGMGAQFGRQAALKGRALAEGAAGFVGMAYDPMRSALGLIPGVGQEKPLRSMVGETLTRAGVPKPATPIERITGAATEMLVPAAGQVGLARQGLSIMGQAPRAVSAGRNVLASLAAQPSQQLAGAAGAGAAAETAREMGGNALTQFGAGLAGGMAGGRLAGARYEAPPTALPQAVQEARRRGINVFTTDIMPPRGFVGGTVRRAGEAIPFVGMSGPRAAQDTQRVQAVKDTLDEFGVDPSIYPDDILKTITNEARTKRKQDVQTLKAEKMSVINGLSPIDYVPTDRTTATIQNALRDLRATGKRTYEPIIAKLENKLADVQNNSLAGLENLRAAQGSEFADLGLANIRTRGDTIMKDVYDAIRTDMGDFIRKNGGEEAFATWKSANDELSDLMDDLDVTALTRMFNRGEQTPELVRGVLMSNKTSDLQTLKKNLTPVGIAAAKKALLQRAMQKGGDIADPGRFNATAFENELGRMERQLNVFFDGDDAATVEGLRKALRLTGQATAARQAGQAPTGQQVMLASLTGLITSLMGGNLLAAGAALGGTGAAIRVFESGPVRDALLKLGKARARPDQNELFKRLISATQATTSGSAPEDNLRFMSDDQLNAELRRLGY